VENVPVSEQAGLPVPVRAKLESVTVAGFPPSNSVLSAPVGE
jgi:hypothetical protein